MERLSSQTWRETEPKPLIGRAALESLRTEQKKKKHHIWIK